MLLANYASDSDSDNEAGPSKPASRDPQPVTRPNAVAPSKGKKRAGPIKITLDPLTSKAGKDDEDGDQGRGSGPEEDERDAKKSKVVPKGGKGSSSLLGMLPAPKRKLPTAIASGSALSVNKSMAAKPSAPTSDLPEEVATERLGLLDDAAGGSSMLLPPSMTRKAKAVAKKGDELPMDLFGLSAAGPAPTPTIPSSAASLKPPDITSAPAVADFVPPAPTPDDPYPGYYQLPSGQWAAYDPDYYHSFFNHAGETAEREADGGKANQGLSEARAEQARKELMAKPKKIADDFEYKAVGQVKGLASERHQLSSLLNTAYTQREELEERIASNKKNARMARTKYGF